jgi:hypothetical protein
LRIGDERRWWNRKITFPAKPVSLIAATLIVASLGYDYFASVVESWLWSLTHHSTATYKGWPGTRYESFSVKAPWMWRQEPGLGADHSIELVRARIGEPFPLDSVLIQRVDSPEDVLKRWETPLPKAANDTLAKAGIPFRYEAFVIDADVASRFSCVATRVGTSQQNPILCASTDGRRWLVTYSHFNPTDEVDLIPILRNLS